MRAVLFPGQGSQYVGMARDFYEKYSSVKKNFEIVDETLGFSLSKIILDGPEEELKLTKNAQPAIMTIGVSIFNVLNEKLSLNLKKSKFFAGHSLGEYTALVCSGSLTLEKAAYLLYQRGKAMQEAVPKGEGLMVAILGMNIGEVEEITNFVQKDGLCEIANDNTDGQIVVSGKKSGIEKLLQVLKERKKKGIILPVSAPFHCSLMKKASEEMASKIESTNFLNPNPAIISNVTAKDEVDAKNIKSLLVKQITSRVRWRESVNYMIKEGVMNFIEIGPGKVLSGLVKKINKHAKITNVNSTEDLKDDKF
jgi:[acyl-carrier-protein] S-malonyltransferase